MKHDVGGECVCREANLTETRPTTCKLCEGFRGSQQYPYKLLAQLHRAGPSRMGYGDFMIGTDAGGSKMALAKSALLLIRLVN
jgi:hypothetical protein